MNKLIRNIFLYIMLAFLLASCSVTKFVPDDQYLLDEVDIRTEAPNMTTTELESYLAQQPNFRVFGLSRLRLLTYSLSGRDTSKRRNRWLRRMGEPPVLYDSYQTLRSDKRLQQYFRSKGYLNAEVHDSVVLKGKKAHVYYLVDEKTPYKIRRIVYDFHNDTILGNFVQKNRFNPTKLSVGSLFDTDVLDSERERINTIARRNGYYNFTKEYVNYMADTSLRSHEVDLTLVLKPYIEKGPNGVMQEALHPRYIVSSINVLTLPLSTAKVMNLSFYDSTAIADDVTLFYEKRPLLRKRVVRNNLRIIPGMWYNYNFVNQTYSRLSGLGIVRSAEISFKEKDTLNHELECNILLAPNKAHTFSLDLEGTNTSGDWGGAVTGALQHKNLFHGSELLSLKARFSAEAISEKTNAQLLKSTDDVIEADGELSLKLPQFVFPFLSPTFRRSINSFTEFKTAYAYQHRPDYDRKIMSAAGRYFWSARRYYKYSIDAFNLNYVYFPRLNQSFVDKYSHPKYSVLRESYSDHLILSAGGMFSYDNQTSKRRLDKKSFRVSYESAGLLFWGISHVFGMDRKLDQKTGIESYHMANIPYSMYQKAEFEYAFNKYIDKKNRVVFHTKVGAECPYLNSQMVPFEKRFFGGGANGVRGWSVRTLGPGSYEPEDKEDFVSQSGNLELTLNAEYRSKLFWLFEGAAFVDAGNIWNVRDYEFQHDGTFYLNEFYKQIALAYGLGLRCDFTYFLVRFDLGVKAYDPALKGRDRWRYHNITWKNDMAFHFAIGYPF